MIWHLYSLLLIFIASATTFTIGGNFNVRVKLYSPDILAICFIFIFALILGIFIYLIIVGLRVVAFVSILIAWLFGGIMLLPQ